MPSAGIRLFFASLLALTGILAGIHFWASSGSAEPEAPTAPAIIWQWVATDQPGDHNARADSGLSGLPPELVHRIAPNFPVAAKPGEHIKLPLPDRASPPGLEVITSYQHANGDITVHARSSDQLERITLTGNPDGGFARITTDQGMYLIHSDASGSWLIDLGDERLSVDQFHGDTLGANPAGQAGAPILHPVMAQAASGVDDSTLFSQLAGTTASTTSSSSNPVQIDVMFVYTPDMLARYPGGLIDTRLNHLVAIANQTMVDSQVNIAVRLVDHRSINYTRHVRNGDAIQDMVRALRGENVPGMAGLNQVRASVGADIVALTWPHDIETRGSCGLAYFPVATGGGNYDPSYGVHIDNDGVSNWSVCSDAVFTHELGHNLTAEHQRSQSSGDDPNRYNYAYVREPRYHTIMGSFGTGDANRYRRLDVFSSPNIQCGGEPCGNMNHGSQANNARAIGDFAPIVAAYTQPTQAGNVVRPAPSNPDSDGDGVSDWDDPWPFDPLDGQAPEPVSHPFVFQARELREPESDTDYELLVVSSGNDRVLAYGLDGRFRGVVTAPEPKDAGPNLTEFSGLDIDEQGRLYLLASGDVRRFDRLSGELIDVFLDASQPQPRELLSPFSRDLGFIRNQSQLLVLGDNAIERYNLAGERLNQATNAQPVKDPNRWTDLLDLPLRAFAATNSRLYVVESETNRILAFSIPDGARQFDVGSETDTVIVDPWDLAIGPGNQLYVANGIAGNVLRYDLNTREFAEVFVSAGSGGLSFAKALAFGPDGHLYVASRNDNRILRFDGNDGSYLGELVASGDGGLDQPESLRFAPIVNQIHAGHSGHYFVPARSGEGWLLEILNSQQAAISWFTYPAEGDSTAGGQSWLVGVGDIQGNRIVFDEVHETTGPAFGPDFDPALVELIPWGRFEFEFDNCTGGLMRYEGPDLHGSGELAFTRLIEIHGLPCGNIPREAQSLVPGLSGQWYDPATGGQGWFLEEIAPDRIFAAWFTYDNLGRQAWLVGEGRWEGDELWFEELQITGGTRFGEGFDAQDIFQENWGSMRMRFDSCNQGSGSFESIDPAYGSGEFALNRLTRLSQLDCEVPPVGQD